MNQELIAHGYANMFSGAFGGLQTYMTYSNSVLYAKSGGKGKISSLLIVAMTMLLFVIGPSIASFLPRCMAGTLLLHIGIDLALEGVYDCTLDVWICLATVSPKTLSTHTKSFYATLLQPLVNTIIWNTREYGLLHLS
jgi:MFS superfamily sulfate permease-like transporter